jgi:hypothetical protein
MWLVVWLGWGEYTSRAMLSTGIVEQVIRTSAPHDTLGITQRYIDDRFTHLSALMASESVIQLLAYRLILHDMNMPEPFHAAPALRADYGEEIWDDARSYYKALLDSVLLPRAADDIVYLQIQTELGYDYPSLVQGLRIARVPGTQFIQVSYSSGQAHYSAFVVNVLCQEFIRYADLMERAKSKTSVIQLEKLAARKRKELDEKMQQLRDYKRMPKSGSRVRNELVHPTKLLRGGSGDPGLDGLVQEVALSLEAYLGVLNKLNAATFESINPESQIRQVEYGTPAAYPGLFPGSLFGVLGGIMGLGLSLGYWWIRESP